MCKHKGLNDAEILTHQNHSHTMGEVSHKKTVQSLDPMDKTSWSVVTYAGGAAVFEGKTETHQQDLLTKGRESRKLSPP